MKTLRGVVFSAQMHSPQIQCYSNLTTNTTNTTNRLDRTDRADRSRLRNHSLEDDSLEEGEIIEDLSQFAQLRLTPKKVHKSIRGEKNAKNVPKNVPKECSLCNETDHWADKCPK